MTSNPKRIADIADEAVTLAPLLRLAAEKEFPPEAMRCFTEDAISQQNQVARSLGVGFTDEAVWREITEAGWGPEFAAGCVIRYARIGLTEAARWYAARVCEMTDAADMQLPKGREVVEIYRSLRLMFTADERATLGLT